MSGADTADRRAVAAAGAERAPSHILRKGCESVFVLRPEGGVLKAWARRASPGDVGALSCRLTCTLALLAPVDVPQVLRRVTSACKIVSIKSPGALAVRAAFRCLPGISALGTCHKRWVPIVRLTETVSWARPCVPDTILSLCRK